MFDLSVDYPAMNAGMEKSVAVALCGLSMVSVQAKEPDKEIFRDTAVDFETRTGRNGNGVPAVEGSGMEVEAIESSFGTRYPSSAKRS